MNNTVREHASVWMLLAGSLGLLVLVGLFIILFNLRPTLINAQNSISVVDEELSQEPQHTFTATQTQEEEVLDTPTPEPTQTLTSTPTMTSAPTPGPALMSPFRVLS